MRFMIIKNGIIFRPDNKFHRGTLAIKNVNLVSEIQVYNENEDEIFDAENFYVIPGLTDIHFHGCMGYDFCDGKIESLRGIFDYESRNGVTKICPATMTLPVSELSRIMRAANSFSKECPGFLGINLEGPFISHTKKGAQNPDYIIPPDIEILRELQKESGGLIRIATVAPEVDGAISFIQEAKRLARVSIAHTACDYDTAVRAFDSGASHVTHLFNAMSPINHRQPGPVIAALENDSVMIEIICDGIHVHPAVVRNTIRTFGADRVIFISDSLPPTGMPEGEYTLGGLKIFKNEKAATLEDKITLAGSVTNLMECVRRAVFDMNIPLETAVRCSAVNPVKALGLDDSYGSIQEGRTADIVILSKELEVVKVLKLDKFGN